jgi:hypothetical protein
MNKNFIKFLSGRGSKSLPLTVFLAEKTEPNYDTDYIGHVGSLFETTILLRKKSKIFSSIKRE